MSVNVESLEELLNQISNTGAILALVADSDGLPIATKLSEGASEETEEALSAFASVILEIGQTICQEIRGSFEISWSSGATPTTTTTTTTTPPPVAPPPPLMVYLIGGGIIVLIGIVILFMKRR